MKLKGKVWIFGDNINTDLMSPGHVKTLPEEEQAKYCMDANRPGWSKEVKRGDILVAGRNFGCGSSRPAAKALLSLGLSCALAESVTGLFLRNAINLGFPVLSLDGVSKMFREGDTAEVDFDTGQIKNMRTGETRSAKPLPPALVKIVESGGIIPQLKIEGYLKDSY